MATAKKDPPQAPPPLDITPVPEDPQLGESMRSLELMARGFNAIHTIVRDFQSLRHQVSSLTRKKAELEEQVGTLDGAAAKSHELHLEAIRRYEKERLQKDAQEKANHEKTKAELYAEAAELSQSIQGLKDRVVAAEQRASDAEAATDQKLIALDDKIAVRKAEIDHEVELVNQPLVAKLAEYKEITDALAALKRKHGIEHEEPSDRSGD